MASPAVGAFIPEALEHLLDDGQAGDDFVEIDDGGEIEGVARPKDLDPDRGVEELQEARFFRFGAGSPRISRRSPSHAPVPRSSRIWRAFARRTKSSSACITAAE